MWRQATNLEPHNGDPPMRTHAASCVLGSKVYVFGGLGAGASNQLWALDTILHRWERLLPPGPNTAPAPNGQQVLHPRRSFDRAPN